MATGLTQPKLAQETEAFRGTGGISEENRSAGFTPAFLDTETRAVYPSRFADGRPAPCHLIDGLPDEALVERSASGRAVSVKTSIVSGFLLGGRFYSRDESAALVAFLQHPA